jgi:hypothetical protein
MLANPAAAGLADREGVLLAVATLAGPGIAAVGCRIAVRLAQPEAMLHDEADRFHLAPLPLGKGTGGDYRLADNFLSPADHGETRAHNSRLGAMPAAASNTQSEGITFGAGGDGATADSFAV